MQTSEYSITKLTNGKSKLAYSVTAGGKHVTFRLKKHSIQVDPKEGWLEIVPEAALHRVLYIMMRDFRSRAHVKEHGIKAAAVGISESGRIFIAANTENRGENDFARDCAEQNMVNIFKQDENTKSTDKLVNVFVMGGRDEGEPSMICPCGNCTDTLSRMMRRADDKIVIFPVPNSSAMPALNHTAKHVFHLTPGQGWLTTINTLNPMREIAVDAKGKQHLEVAQEELIAHMPHDPDVAVLPKLRASLKPEDAIFQKAVVPIQFSLHQYSEHKKGLPDIARYMQSKIYTAFSARLADDPAFTSLTTLEERRNFIAQKFTSVQVAVVQLKDGTFREAISVVSDYDRSTPSAVTQAALLNQDTNQPITHVWVSEYRPVNLEKSVTSSPSKESIERTIKRGGKSGEVQFHILPFMRLSLSEGELAEYTHHFPASGLFPGYFTGRSQPQNQPSLVHEGVVRPLAGRQKS